MNIAVCFDKNYQKWATVCLYSIWEQHKNQPKIRLFIISDINDSQIIKQLKAVLKNFVYSIHNPDGNFKNLPTGYHFAIPVYWRLLLPNILKEQGIQKVIYLDVDTLVIKPLNELFNLDINRYELGASLDISSREQTKRLALNQRFYVNSGVILMNILEMSKIDWVSEANRLNDEGRIEWVDQDVINILSDEKIVLLDQKWNVQTGDFQNGYDGDVSIVHYTESNNSKPWSIKSKHRYLGVYNTYMKKSGFYWDYFQLELVRWIRKNLV